MVANALHNPVEVTFISAGSQMDIRMQEGSVDAICEAAKTLRATHFVIPGDWLDSECRWSWEVHELRRAQKGNPIPGAWCLGKPIKVFPTREAAEMCAVILARKQ